VDSATTGLADQRGGGVANQSALAPSPKRLGAQSADVSTIALSNLASFVGSGGGGGNSGGDNIYATAGLLGSGGGGAGARRHRSLLLSGHEPGGQRRAVEVVRPALDHAGPRELRRRLGAERVVVHAARRGRAVPAEREGLRRRRVGRGLRRRHRRPRPEQ